MEPVIRCRFWMITAAMRWGCTGCQLLRRRRCIPAVVRTFERYGVPEAMLMDRGAVWWSYDERLRADLAIGAADRARYPVCITGACIIRKRRGKWSDFIARWMKRYAIAASRRQMAEWPEGLEEFR